MDPIRVAIIGDFRVGYAYHQATNDALTWTAGRLGLALGYEWVSTDNLPGRATEVLEAYDGIWASPGSPYRSMEGALDGIRFARESGRPFVGT